MDPTKAARNKAGRAAALAAPFRPMSSFQVRPGTSAPGHNRTLVERRFEASQLKSCSRPLGRVFDIDPGCGSELEIIAAIWRVL